MGEVSWKIAHADEWLGMAGGTAGTAQGIPRDSGWGLSPRELVTAMCGLAPPLGGPQYDLGHALGRAVALDRSEQFLV